MIAAKRYAEGLFYLAKETGQLHDFMNDLNLISSFIKNEDFLAKYISDELNKKEKKEFVNNKFNGLISKDVLNLIFLLIDKKREMMLPYIPYYYKQYYDIELGNVDVTLYSSFDIDKETINKIISWLKKNYSLENINLTISIQPELIGGIKIVFKNTEIDASIKGWLENMREELVKNAI